MRIRQSSSRVRRALSIKIVGINALRPQELPGSRQENVTGPVICQGWPNQGIRRSEEIREAMVIQIFKCLTARQPQGPQASGPPRSSNFSKLDVPSAHPTHVHSIHFREKPIDENICILRCRVRPYGSIFAISFLAGAFTQRELISPERRGTSSTTVQSPHSPPLPRTPPMPCCSDDSPWDGSSRRVSDPP